MANDFLTYKGKPVVRKDKTIYYGDMSERYVTMLQILASEKKGDVVVATKVSVQLLSTSPKADDIAKKSEKSGLFEALDIANIWLTRYNKE